MGAVSAVVVGGAVVAVLGERSSCKISSASFVPPSFSLRRGVSALPLWGLLAHGARGREAESFVAAGLETKRRDARKWIHGSRFGIRIFS